MAKNTLNPCGCESGTIPVIGAGNVIYQGVTLSCLPINTNEGLNAILGKIDSRFCNTYTKSEADNQFANKNEVPSYAVVNQSLDVLEFYNSDDALLFDVDITYFVSQAVTVEVSGNSVLLKDKFGNILSSATLPGSGMIEIDNHPFRYVKGFNGSSTIQIGDIASGGIFTDGGFEFYGDLLCIDNTGDLTTGIGTKWKPINQVRI